MVTQLYGYSSFNLTLRDVYEMDVDEFHAWLDRLVARRELESLEYEKLRSKA